MTMYQPNIPTGLIDLDEDYLNILHNFQQLNTSFGIDHIPFDIATNNGYHTNIHQIPQGAPAPIGGINQLFTQNVTPNTTGGTPDTQLFSLTGVGGLSQLTGNHASTEGYQWIGGVLIQWGNKTGFSGAWPGGNQTLTFKDRAAGLIPFPNNCFTVVTNFIGPPSSSKGSVSIISTSATNFVWNFDGSSGSSYGGFYWIAIGN